MRVVAVSLVAVLAGMMGSAGGVTFQASGSGPDGKWFEPTGMSGDGTTLVGRLIKNVEMEAVIWTVEDGFRTLGHLPPTPDWSTGWAADYDGNVVVGTVQQGAEFHAFIWTPGNGMVALPVVNGAGGGAAYGVSPDGRTIVGTNKVTNPDGFAVDAPVKWTPKPTGGWRVLQMRAAAGGDISGYVRAVTSGGIAAGESTSGKGDVATRWSTSGHGVGKGALLQSPFKSWAHAISSDGNVLCGASLGGGFRPVVWGAGGVAMRKLSDSDGEATDITSDGRTVTGFVIGETFRQDCFIWSEAEGMRSIKQILIDAGVTGLEDWSFYKPFISADGRVVGGWGGAPVGGFHQGWIARLEDEESSTYEEWSTEEGRDDAFDGDGNGDGVADGAEYATGERNAPRARGAAIVIRGTGPFKRCVFPRRTGLTGVDVIPQFSPDGVNWSPLVDPIYTVDRVGAFDRNEVALPEGRSGILRILVKEQPDGK